MSSASLLAANRSSKEFQAIYDQALIKLLARQHMSFLQVSGESWKEFIETFTKYQRKIPPISIRHPITISRHVDKNANQVRSALLQILEKHRPSISSISFTTDIWSSRNGDPFISLTIQYLTENFEMVRMVPFVSHFVAKHDGVNISLELTEMLGELNLLGPELKKYLVTDNASNMKLAVQLTSDVNDLRCSNHLLELLLKDSLEGVLVELVEKCQKLAVKLQRSPKLKEELKEACKKVNIDFITPKAACKTRWNSRGRNLESVVKLKKALSHLAVEGDSEAWGDFWISSGDWKRIEMIAETLGKVKIVSKAFEAETTPTSNLVIYHIFNMKSELQEASRSVSMDRYFLFKHS